MIEKAIARSVKILLKGIFAWLPPNILCDINYTDGKASGSITDILILGAPIFRLG
jgi:hypothetical protein